MRDIKHDIIYNIFSFIYTFIFLIFIYSSPIAIGTTTTSTKDLKKNGMKGRAIKVLHYIKDQLW